MKENIFCDIPLLSIILYVCGFLFYFFILILRFPNCIVIDYRRYCDFTFLTVVFYIIHVRNGCADPNKQTMKVHVSWKSTNECTSDLVKGFNRILDQVFEIRIGQFKENNGSYEKRQREIRYRVRGHWMTYGNHYIRVVNLIRYLEKSIQIFFDLLSKCGVRL